MTRTPAAVTVVGLWLAAASCGSGNGGGSGSPIGGGCVMVGACGGNIVGNWVVSTSCYQAQGSFGSSCPEGTISASAQYSGTFSFGADGSYTSSLTASAIEMIWIPATCLARQPGITTCDQLNQSGGGAPPSPVITVQCTPSPRGGCDCNETITRQEVPPAGTYATSGSTLTLNPTSGTATTFSYCAGVIQLDLLPPGNPGGPNASGDIRFGRQ